MAMFSSFAMSSGVSLPSTNPSILTRSSIFMRPSGVFTDFRALFAETISKTTWPQRVPTVMTPPWALPVMSRRPRVSRVSNSPIILPRLKMAVPRSRARFWPSSVSTSSIMGATGAVVLLSMAMEKSRRVVTAVSEVASWCSSMSAMCMAGIFSSPGSSSRISAALPRAMTI